MKNIRLFFRILKPIPLVTCLLMYSLGVGIIDYQKESVDIQAYLLGQSWVILIQLSMTFLSKFFSHRKGKNLEYPNAVDTGNLLINNDHEGNKVYWWGGLTSFSGAAVISVLLITNRLMSVPVVLLLLLTVISVILFTTPPFTVERSGYGEFLLSFWVVFLIPAVAYSLQKGGNFGLLFFILVPSFFLHFAMQLALEFRTYKVFPIKQAENFLGHFGWRIGIYTHNASILACFLVVGIGFIWGFPKFTFYIGLSLLPLGIFQILQMRRIQNGAKPLWNMIELGAYSLFFLNAYLLSYAFWVQ